MKHIKEITIVGGGSSGWMTALALKNKLKNVVINLIEDPSIGAIGVGESTTPPVMSFINKYLELTPEDWIPHTNASFKVGTEFVGWSDEKFYSTFKVSSSYDQKKENWFVKKVLHPDTPLSNFFESIFPSVSMIQQNKFDIDLNENAWAVHFNAGLFGEYLKGVSIDKGVNYIEGRVASVHKDVDDNIEQLTLEDGNSIHSDLFIDCTGFASVLRKTFDNNFKSVDDFLINNTALVVRKPRKENEEISVCTRSFAADAGWIWEIPMRTETAYGYVHCDKYISEKDAKSELLKLCDMKEDTSTLKVKFRSGRYEESWVKNCVSIGLSSGFLEPLESTGLWFTVYSIQDMIKSITQMKAAGYHNPTRSLFNINYAKQFDSVSSFIQLHFIGAHKNDTPYWKYVTEKLEGNQEMIDGLVNISTNGPYTYIPGFFDTYLWSGITMGLGLTTAQTWLGRNYSISGDENIASQLDVMSNIMLRNVKTMKNHKDFLYELIARNENE